MNLNKAFILGRLTRDPEQRTMPNGKAVSSFSIATNRVWTDQGSGVKQEQAEFHNVVAFGRLAEICNQYLTKGQLVLIEGRIQTRSWEDQNGNRRTRTEIIAENMQMGSKPGGGREQEGAPETTESIAEVSVDDTQESPEEKPKNKKGKKKQEDNSGNGEIDVKDIPF